jgi:hypothetical protein
MLTQSTKIATSDVPPISSITNFKPARHWSHVGDTKDRTRRSVWRSLKFSRSWRVPGRDTTTDCPMRVPAASDIGATECHAYRAASLKKRGRVKGSGGEMFCDTRPLAEEWTFRFLGAALANTQAEHEIGLDLEDLQ